MRRTTLVTGSLGILAIAALIAWAASGGDRAGAAVAQPAPDKTAAAGLQDAARPPRTEVRRSLLRELRVGGAPKPSIARGLPGEADPFHAVLEAPESGDGPSIVVEAAALYELPVGQALRKCMERKRRELGVLAGDDHVSQVLDAMRSVERVGISGKQLLIAGDFNNPNLRKLVLDEVKPSYASQDDWVMGLDEETAGGRAPLGAVIDDRYVLQGFGGREGYEGALARVRGAAPANRPAFDEWERYGEAYGRLPGTFVDRLAAELPESLRESARGSVDEVVFHVDAQEDVVVTIELRGGSRAGLAAVAAGLKVVLATLTVTELERPFAKMISEAAIDLGAAGVTIQMRSDPYELVAQIPECRVTS